MCTTLVSDKFHVSIAGKILLVSSAEQLPTGRILMLAGPGSDGLDQVPVTYQDMSCLVKCQAAALTSTMHHTTCIITRYSTSTPGPLAESTSAQCIP